MGASSTAGLDQALDFRDECDALHAALENAPAEAWAEPTQFKGWTFDDVLGHLYFFDHASEIAARSRDEVQALFRDIFQASATGVSLIDYSRRWLQGCAGSALLERWRTQYQRLAEIYAAFEPGHRLAWAGPDMSARSFMSARQMETWAHGQAIFDALGIDRVEHDRLRNIAVMGVNTFDWTFKVNRRDIACSEAVRALDESVRRAVGVERAFHRGTRRGQRGGVLSRRHADAKRARHEPGGDGRYRAAMAGERAVLRGSAGVATGAWHAVQAGSLQQRVVNGGR